MALTFEADKDLKKSLPDKLNKDLAATLTNDFHEEDLDGLA